jgi:hypothetical protein
MRVYKTTKTKLLRPTLPKLFPYSYENKETWPYTDCIITKRKNKLVIERWIKNPHFKYGKLLKDY